MAPRFSLALIALIFVFILPWWLSGPFFLLLIFLFPWYYEAVVIVLSYDLLYGSNYLWLTIVCILLIPLAEEIKKRLYVFS